MLKQIRPMLAAEENKKLTVLRMADPNWVGEEKFNGCRYVAHFQPDRLYFTSRHLSKDDPTQHVEKGENVPHLNRPVPSMIGTILDGEICVVNKRESSYKVTKFMGCDPAKAIERQKKLGWVKYRVWDILEHSGEDVRTLPLRERRKLLKETIEYWIIKNPNIGQYIELVEWTTDKEALLETVLARKGEGIILKHLDSPYVENARNAAWVMKVKKEQTWDGVIMGYEDPKQYTTKVGDDEPTVSRLWKNGWIGTIVFGMYKDGKLVEVGKCSGMPDKKRKEISENKEKFLGKVIEVKGQEMTEDGAIQNPRYIGIREDKDAKDCIFTEEGR